MKAWKSTTAVTRTRPPGRFVAGELWHGVWRGVPNPSLISGYGDYAHRRFMKYDVQICRLRCTHSDVGCVAQWWNVGLWTANFSCLTLDLQLMGDSYCG